MFGIGVSNLIAHCCNAGIELSDILLATNPSDYHPYLDQASLMTATLKAGVATTASNAMAIGRVLAEPILLRIAGRHGIRNASRKQQDEGRKLNQTYNVFLRLLQISRHR